MRALIYVATVVLFLVSVQNAYTALMSAGPVTSQCATGAHNPN